jgi:hypothetical protein
MLYFYIIFQTLIDIILFNNLLLSFYFYLFILFIYLLSKQIKVNSNKRRFILLFRFSILLLIIPLFDNKIFKDQALSFRTQNIGVMIDNSLSVNKILDSNSINIISYLNQIEDWGYNKNINLSWYDLDTIINKNDLLFDNETTSFDYIKDISLNKELDQLLLISDGMINSGFIFNDSYNKENIIIHSIGLGDFNIEQDIGITDFKTKILKDSINFNISFSINTNKNNSFIYNVFSDNSVIYSDTIKVISGKYNFDKEIIFHSKYIGNNIINEVIPIAFSDSKPHNNLWNINLSKDNKNKILMLTGRLTYNTSFIKSNLSSISNIDLNHQIVFDQKFDYSELLKHDFDCIILDNFPNNSYDYDFFKKINDKQSNIMFFEGYNFNPDFLKMMLDIISPQNFYIDNMYTKKHFTLEGNLDLGYFESNYNLFCNDSSNLNKVNFFSNGSIAQLSLSNFYAFLIPNISQLSFFMKTKYNNKYLDEYFKYLVNKNLNNNFLLNLKLHKNNYSMGEKLLFKLDNNIPFDVVNKTIIINDLDRMLIDSIDFDSEVDLFFNKNGKFEIYFSFIGTNLEVINSNKESFFVDKYNIELEGSVQNMELLKNISSESGGFYTDIDSLDISFLESINSSFIEEDLKNIYSALDIFIKQKIFLLIIMFFCLEIYLRKKIGLL